MQPFTLYKTSWEIRPIQDLNPPLQVALPLTTIMTRIWTLTSNTSWVRSTLSKINKRRLRNKIGVLCKLQPRTSYRGSTIHRSVRSFRSILILTSREINVNLSKLSYDLKPFYKSEFFTIKDIMLAAHLWGLYVVPEFQFKPDMHFYLQQIKKLTKFNYQKDFWR